MMQKIFDFFRNRSIKEQKEADKRAEDLTNDLRKDLEEFKKKEKLKELNVDYKNSNW